MPNITGNFGVPNPYSSEQQRIAELLRQAGVQEQQGMQPIPDASSMIQSGPFSYYAPDAGYGMKAIAQGLRGYSAKKKREEALAQSDALNTRYTTEGQDAMAKGLRALQGTPAGMENRDIPDADTGGLGQQMTATPAVPGDKMAAMQAFGSHPMTAPASQSILADMLKKPDSPWAKINPKDFTQPSLIKFAQTQNPADLVPARKLDAVGGVAVDMYAQKPGAVLPQNPNDLMQRDQTGAVSVNQPLLAAKKDIAKSGASSQVVKLPPQENAFEVGLGKGQAENLLKSKVSAEDAAQIINTIGEGRKLLNSGMITGKGAEWIIGFGQVLKQAGVDFGKNDPVANSQAYGANMAGNVGKIIKQFGSGTGLSDADREYAAAMAGGKITMDENAIRRILDISEKQARWTIQYHNKQAAGVKSKLPLTVDEPPDVGGAPAAPGLPPGVTVKRIP